MSDETTSKSESKKSAKSPTADAKKAKPAAKAKKPKVEDKPFTEFIEQDFLPALKKALTAEGIGDLDLKFAKGTLPIAGASAAEACWQVAGSWSKKTFQFNLYFPDEDIKGQKGFSFSAYGGKPSTLESFMIDERRVTLELMVLYVLQRLNGQKLLARN